MSMIMAFLFAADNRQVIQIDSVQAYLGVAAVLIAIGAAWGTLKTSVSQISDELKDNIKPDLKDVRERFAALEAASKGLTATKSPVGLTAEGVRYITESDFKDFIDNNIDSLLEMCDKDRNLQTSYDVQQAVFDFFDSYEFPEELDNKIKTYAFNQGLSLEVMHRLGAIYFRDIALKKLGFKPEDLDKKSEKKAT